MMTDVKFEQDLAKLVEAVIYLCDLSEDDPEFGLSKLTKLLYYADFDAYLEYGQPITGTSYLHFPHGPHPENWYQIREQMEQRGEVEILYDPAVTGCQSYRVLPLRSANLELLSPNDRETLEAQVRRFIGFNEAGIEHYSHQEFGWRSTEDGEPIPYALAGVVSVPLSARKIKAGPPIIRE